MISREQWRWFGHPGHFIGGHNCRFHLCTLVGDHLISTVGDYRPNLPEAKDGPVEIGVDRTYETMVFAAGTTCSAAGCDCGLPEISGSELDFDGYTTAGTAAAGHMALCEKWAARGKESVA